MSGPRHSRFSPHLVAPANLERLFVEREPLVARLVSDLLGNVTGGGARYVLLVGPRGAGKSHLSALVRHRLRSALGAAGVVVALDEEEHVGSLVDLFARVLRGFPVEEGLPTAQEQLKALKGLGREEAFERAVGLVEARLDERPLVLFLENVDQLFEDLGRDAQQRLRATLQTHPRWSVVATSRTHGPLFTKPQQPFFNTFAAHVLEPFGPEACRQQLALLSELDRKEDLAAFLRTPTGLGRVRAIHHFTGGNPRAMALVYPYLTRERLDDLVDAFYDLSDELTPYFQEQMARLAPGQRPVMEALAENWRPMSPSELSDALFQPQAHISMQLKRLREDRLVAATTVGRERFYEIAEPLHRLARAMKRTGQTGDVLARFLRHWHEPEELDRMLGLEDALRLELRAHLQALARSEVAETPYDAAERAAIAAYADPSEALARARAFHERRQTPVSAGMLVYSLAMGEDTVASGSEIATLLRRPVVLPEPLGTALGERAGATLLGRGTVGLEIVRWVARTPGGGGPEAWFGVGAAAYHRHLRREAHDALLRAGSLPGAMGVARAVLLAELRLLDRGDRAGGIEALEWAGAGRPPFIDAILQCLVDGNAAVFAMDPSDLTERRLASGLVRTLLTAGRADALEHWRPSPEWLQIFMFALLADAATGSEAGPEVTLTLSEPMAGLLETASALAVLPGDATSYARLSAEERAIGRQVLTFFEAHDKLSALPPEPTTD